MLHIKLIFLASTFNGVLSANQIFECDWKPNSDGLAIGKFEFVYEEECRVINAISPFPTFYSQECIYVPLKSSYLDSIGFFVFIFFDADVLKGKNYRI